MFTASGTTHRKRASAKKHGVSRTPGHNDPSNANDDDLISRVDLNYGNKLLSLRAALNEKELQLVELREQHISVVNRGAIARKNWEDALKSKDQVIIQLQKALHAKKCELDRQERVNEENIQRLLQQREEEENAELEQKERKISHLEAKNSQFVQEVVDQQKTLAKLKKQLEDRERQCASHLHKIEVINGRVQDLKAALQKKEEIVETQQKYCQELKALLWKRDSVIGQLQLAEQQLQSSLARQEAEYEALECAKQKLQEEKDAIEKNLADLRHNLDSVDSGSLHRKCEKGFKEKEAVLRKQKRQIQELGRCLESTEETLDAKRKDYQHLLEEKRRLQQKYDSLTQEFEEAQRIQRHLESNLGAVQERLLNAERVISEAEQEAIVEAAQFAPSLERSIAADQAGDNLMDDFLELERQSNGSVVHNSGTYSRESKQQSSKPSFLFEASRPPADSSARNSSSSARRGTKDGSKVQLMRKPQASEILNAVESKHSFSVDRNQRPPKVPTFQGSTPVSKTYYQALPIDSVKKGERKAWSVTDTTRRQQNSNSTMANGQPAGKVVEASDVRSQSSESSQQSSPSKQDLGSFSEMYRVAGGERSPTLIEAFQNSSLGAQKKTPTYICTSRKRTNSHLPRSPPSSDDSQTLSLNDRRSNFSVAAHESKAAAQANGWSMQDCTMYEAHQPSPRDGDIRTSNGNRGRQPSRVSGSHEASDFSPAPYLEQDRLSYFNTDRDSKERAMRQARSESNKLSSNGGNVSHGQQKLPVSATKPDGWRNLRNKDSMRPPTPASDIIQGSSESALRSLQDEVMKRERGWRRTEANMRAALCQRLAELNGTDQSIKGDDFDMIERAKLESKRSVQRRKT
ncbi:hypothetical protein MPTK1_4g07780 [Marchantia polymorpha subsp. ruderalis]|uniref:Uncharacterized protein n=2 Tax=Marchantia polymorpha TaxID=3197 RepID=A0AAF6B7J4_MARPO|nr:hypothetical protein MARPO_0115s0002 [Marchantia polymorpha]BBN07978.1 hypothetical protein Mp_4g07780 [Marchantia polymorpha subsp. ruderalis]|eukprot:PTQ31074.1 hypothetical protein MARPO_0115s0002 [Marchantia polymorpha]